MGKGRHKNKQYLLMSFLVMICLMLSVVSIHAESGSLTFTNSWVTSGHTFYLYKIADFSDYKLTVKSEYASAVDVSHSTTDSDYWRTAASNIVTVINNNNIAASYSATSGDQTVTFGNIELGMYLVTSDSFQTTVDSKYYSAAPTIVSVPKNTADTVFSVSAELKPTIRDVPVTPTPTPKKTTTEKKKKTTKEKKKKSTNSNGSGDNSGKNSSSTNTSGDGGVDDGKNSKTSTNTSGGSENDKSKNKNTQTSSTSVKTGDTTKISIYVVLLIFSGLALLMTISKLKLRIRGRR